MLSCSRTRVCTFAAQLYSLDDGMVIVLESYDEKMLQEVAKPS
jgi:hypothetical protein